jgi:hypothetical protein
MVAQLKESEWSDLGTTGLNGGFAKPGVSLWTPHIIVITFWHSFDAIFSSSSNSSLSFLILSDYGNAKMN